MLATRTLRGDETEHKTGNLSDLHRPRSQCRNSCIIEGMTSRANARLRPGKSDSGGSPDYARMANSVEALVGDRRHPGLVFRLGKILSEPNGAPATGAIGRRPPAGREPWNPEAAAVYWRVHSGARDLEKDLRHARAIPPLLPPRGGSETNTIEALRAVSLLAVALPDDLLRRAADRVERWANAARRVRDLDELDKWVPVPQVPGSLPPACPYCESFSLRMSLGRSEVRCFKPGCLDMDGHQPVAKMEPGRLTGSGILVFRDETVVHYADG